VHALAKELLESGAEEFDADEQVDQAKDLFRCLLHRAREEGVEGAARNLCKARAYAGMARCELEHDDTEQEEEYATEATQLAPAFHEGWEVLVLGDAVDATDRPGQAAVAWQSALENENVLASAIVNIETSIEVRRTDGAKFWTKSTNSLGKQTCWTKCTTRLSAWSMLMRIERRHSRTSFAAACWAPPDA